MEAAEGGGYIFGCIVIAVVEKEEGEASVIGQLHAGVVLIDDE